MPETVSSGQSMMSPNSTMLVYNRFLHGDQAQHSGSQRYHLFKILRTSEYQIYLSAQERN